MKRVLLGLIAVVFLGGGVAVLFGEQLIVAAAKRQARTNMTGEVLSGLPDGLHLMMCGSGAPLPDPTRAGPCIMVYAGQNLYVVDIGSGATRNFGPMGIPTGRVEAVFLTHFHSDHFDGLGELMTTRWAAGARKQPLPVYGPPGVEQILQGLNLAYAQDVEYRIAHHGETVAARAGAGGVPRVFRQPAMGELLTVLEKDGLKISTFAVEHEPVSPAVGYRFDYKGRSLVISGDTKASKNLQHFSRDVDLLAHEALSPQVLKILEETAEETGVENIRKIMVDVLDYHTTPVQAAEIARDAKVRHLLLYHLVPPAPVKPLEWLFMRGVSEVFGGDVTLARDGMLFSLPANSEQITQDGLLRF